MLEIISNLPAGPALFLLLVVAAALWLLGRTPAGDSGRMLAGRELLESMGYRVLKISHKPHIRGLYDPGDPRNDTHQLDYLALRPGDRVRVRGEIECDPSRGDKIAREYEVPLSVTDEQEIQRLTDQRLDRMLKGDPEAHEVSDEIRAELRAKVELQVRESSEF